MHYNKYKIKFRGYNISMNISKIQAHSFKNTTNQQAQKEPKKREVKKVYPNAPCPCGSGKKYKLCCGRN